MTHDSAIRSPERLAARLWRWAALLGLGVSLVLGAYAAPAEEADFSLEELPSSSTAASPATPPLAEDLPEAAPEASGGPAVEPAAGQGVELERLLQLPDSFEAVGDRRGGASAGEWRSRFQAARDSLETARSSLQEAQTKLENAVEDSADYAVTAPGAADAATNSPVSFALRQDLRRLREQVAREERSLRTLEIEADLAEVPDDWRR